ncbi:heterotrimeric G-protein alpha subunit, GPA3-like protein [Mycena rebaudengoi]|nr:heterotrimeric G-protein alpha subunit, GPA3-like protein [Mycena rebaudengoi]
MTISQPPFSKRALLAKARSDAIDQQILNDSVHFGKECKILLLGAGESGKSAIVKRMKIHHGGFDAGELAEYRTTIHRNVLDSADALTRVVRRVGIDALEGSERAHAVQLLAAFPVAARAGEALKVGLDPVPLARVKLTPALADIIWHVAHIPAIDCFLAHATDFYLMDNVMYFFASMRRIASPTYVPSEEDIMRTRLTPTAITETRFPMGCLSIRIIDVGGQRSERKKWIHCFESVTSVLFCTALSEYDEVCLEDRRVNRMRESLYLFESVINSRWFLRTSIILFLNRIDVFKQKLPKSPLERYFPEYTGGNDLQKAAKFILWKFMQENRAKLTVYPHVTQANDITNIRLVFAAAKETILQNALKDSGIL